jgi:hypothetical protein
MKNILELKEQNYKNHYSFNNFNQKNKDLKIEKKCIKLNKEKDYSLILKYFKILKLFYLQNKHKNLK